ncbi:MAG: acyl-CoA dehydrogenase family protein [Planctomycetota bacterium]|nr:acyl-CoA dehydrogenase family protein [Planctomycetota bacterium]
MSAATEPQQIQSPDDPMLEQLCQSLRGLANQVEIQDSTGVPRWPDRQLELCAQHGVFRWFIDEECGGLGWSDGDLARGYLALGAACQTTTFIITQRTGACQRIAMGGSDFARESLLPDLLDGSQFSTVGISHLTTSHRHLSEPILTAEETPGGFVLNGFCPWVTGATQAETVVVGATLADGRQILTVMPTALDGVTLHEPACLLALSSSHTGKVSMDQVVVDRKWLLGGPVENVMAQGVGARTGGLQTSTLALGLAGEAIQFIRDESEQRQELKDPVQSLQHQWQVLRDELLETADGRASCAAEDLRMRANDLVIRATQASLSAAKGAGFVTGHPAGRWCREALFFMVWSCPQYVMNAQLCQLAGIQSAAGSE